MGLGARARGWGLEAGVRGDGLESGVQGPVRGRVRGRGRGRDPCLAPRIEEVQVAEDPRLLPTAVAAAEDGDEPQPAWVQLWHMCAQPKAPRTLFALTPPASECVSPSLLPVQGSPGACALPIALRHGRSCVHSLSGARGTIEKWPTERARGWLVMIIYILCEVQINNKSTCRAFPDHPDSHCKVSAASAPTLLGGEAGEREDGHY